VSSQGLTDRELHEATAAWWLLLLLGLIGIAAGVVVLAKPGDSLATLAVIAGIFVLIDATFALVASMRRQTENRGLAAILGVLGVVVGVLLIRHPIRGVLAIALLIGIWLIAIGVVRLIEAFERPRRGWNILVALIEIVAGIVIVSSPPIGFSTLALLAGISFIANGVLTLALGWMLRAMRREKARSTFDASVTA
jgi:uncharacterized membrane protein HdeD (DUF308 family)